MRNITMAIAVASTFLTAAAAQAATITNGFTFTVASSCRNRSRGTHFHSSTAGDYGNPAGKAEVGSYDTAGCEETRGLSEYNLAGLAAAPSAFVSFNVFSLGGLFDDDFPHVGNKFLYAGDIAVEAYRGNNHEDIRDYKAPSIGTVGTFSTASLVTGGILSFDITELFNQLIAGGIDSLGIRLRIASAPNGGAVTFDNFRLTTDDLTTPSAVPLPAGLPLVLTGLGALGLAARRRRRA